MIAAIRNNLGIKILSFAIALAIWGFTKASDPVEEGRMQLEVVVRNAPVGGDRAEDPGKQNRRSRRHRQSQRIGPTSADEPQGDSRRADGWGRPDQKVHPRMEPTLPDLVSVQFVQNSFTVQVDESQTADFTPEEVTEGQLQNGWFVNSKTGLPGSVTVEGAKTLVSQVDRVIYYLDLSALTGSAQLTVKFIPLAKSGSEVQNLTVNPPTADIGVDLQPSQSAKTVPIVVDYQGYPAPNHSVTSLASDPFMVEVSGPASSLSKIKNVRTAQIDLTGKTASFDQTVNLISPSDDVTMSGRHATVTVEIQEEAPVPLSPTFLSIRKAPTAHTCIRSPRRALR